VWSGPPGPNTLFAQNRWLAGTFQVPCMRSCLNVSSNAIVH
jgi:hypothetical protein